ncbi:MAG: transposase [Bacilli bacterium]|nr:transposase [Bacilli bacterium]MCH4210834.1 transposase [Bacilli bacterium]MCH4277748.1 transposase [Bacilli bacterium]MCI2055008.1 transposase [Bacilli bacterium]
MLRFAVAKHEKAALSRKARRDLRCPDCQIPLWHDGIRKDGVRITNGIAEAINNVIKTIIKSAYGYRNFDRFRKRVMLIVTYSKKK